MLANSFERIVIAGAGMTGALSAALLRFDLTNTSSEVVIIDKSRGTGGRMSTSRSNEVETSTVDLGAQYISVAKDYQIKHKTFHDELISNGLLTPLIGSIEGDRSAGDTVHYVTPKGVSSLVKYFIKKSDSILKTDTVIQSVDVDKDQIKVEDSKGHRLCDALILTMPVPQILALKGNIQQLINSKSDVKKNLEDVSYSSRFALGLFYKPGTQLNYSWSGKYITDNPCIRFVAIDNKKRGLDSSDIGPSIVVHTSVPFSLKNLETDKEDMRDIIMSHLKQVLPDLPEPVEVKSHKWRYSQVHKGYEGSPGCVVLNEKPLIILAGDGFTHSNLDGCISSALSVQRTVTELCKL